MSARANLSAYPGAGRRQQFQFLVTETPARRVLSKQVYDEAAPVVVCEISTGAVLHLLAREVSAYRHCLLKDGRVFDILNVAAPR